MDMRMYKLDKSIERWGMNDLTSNSSLLSSTSQSIKYLFPPLSRTATSLNLDFIMSAFTLLVSNIMKICKDSVYDKSITFEHVSRIWLGYTSPGNEESKSIACVTIKRLMLIIPLRFVHGKFYEGRYCWDPCWMEQP